MILAPGSSEIMTVSIAAATRTKPTNFKICQHCILLKNALKSVSGSLTHMLNAILWIFRNLDPFRP